MCGLPRTFKLCSKNIIKNLLECNSQYNFTIIISTDRTFANRIKWSNKIDKLKYDNISDLEKDLTKCYTTKNSQIHKILYLSLNDAPCDFSIFPLRLKSILDYCNNNKCNIFRNWSVYDKQSGKARRKCSGASTCFYFSACYAWKLHEIKWYRPGRW
mgnify:CR=1 FL=1